MPNVRVVLIAGPSSSGKTSFANRLCVQLRVLGIKPHKVSLDDYFINRDKTPLDENGKRNFERIEALDLKHLLFVQRFIDADEVAKMTVYNRLIEVRHIFSLHQAAPFHLFHEYTTDLLRVPLDENGKRNFERIEALDLKQLNKDLKAIIAGEQIELPYYNFVTGKRSAYCFSTFSSYSVAELKTASAFSWKGKIFSSSPCVTVFHASIVPRASLPRNW